MSDAERIAALSRAEKLRLAEALLRRRADREQTLPLSSGQQSLWLAYQMDPANTAYNVTGLVAVHGALDPDALGRALQGVVERHPLLRATYQETVGQPTQRIHPRLLADFRAIDCSAWSQEQLTAWQQAEADRPFDLEQGPLLRLTLLSRSHEQHLLLLVAHHIAVDFWSLQLLVNDLRALYAAHSRAHAPGETTLPPLTASFADYLAWQREMLDGPDGERLWAYWRDKLSGELPVLELPADRPRPTVQSLDGAAVHFDLGPDLTARLRAVARATNATLYGIVLTAFYALLHRYTGQDDLIVGSPIAGRTQPRFQPVVGYFVNPVPLRADLSGNPSVRDLVQQVRRTVAEALEHQDLPFPLLVQRLQPARDPARPPIFQVGFNWTQTRSLENQDLAPASGSSAAGNGAHARGLAFELLRWEQRGAPLELLFMMSEGSRTLSGSLHYATSLFQPDTIERLIGHFRVLLDAMAANPDARLAELPLLTEAERRQILVEWNDTERPYPINRTLASAFAEQLARTPDATALTWDDGSLSFRQLDQRAARLARLLRHEGVGPGTLVGICLERSPVMVEGLLAILKAGGAYLPLDPNYPAERLAYMLTDARAPLLLTQSWLAERLPAHQANIVALDRLANASVDDLGDPSLEISAAVPESPAYVIYTSGTTGGPKGVVVSHRAVLNTLSWLQDQFVLDAGDVVAQKTSLSFTDSVWEIFWPLITGAQLALIEDAAVRDPDLLYQRLEEFDVTYTQFVPPVMMRFLEAVGALAPAEPLPRLKWIFNGGEALPPAAASAWYAAFPRAQIANIYGMTESAIYATLAIVPRPKPGQPAEVLIGRPIANARVYLLDRSAQLAPVGVPGEIHIGGIGLADGYLHRPELTDAAFIPDPFVAGGRLYKTGDLGRWRPDGTLEYLGRADHQVKIRGFRVELGEVETALGLDEAVREAVVVAREHRPGDRRLLGYVTPNLPLRPDPVELRQMLNRSLPDYMIPTSIMVLDHLPLTPNGKVDRRALPAPPDDRARGALGQAIVPPRDELEVNLARIWADVLGLPEVGVHDNFFELGGHSLMAMQVAARVRAAGIALPLRQLFEQPTIAGLAQAIRQASAIAPVADDSLGQIPRLDRGQSESVPLSFAQERLWFFDQLDPGSPVYVIPAALRVRGPLDLTALRTSLDLVVARHETLRTRFESVDGRARQVIDDAVAVPIEVNDLSALPDSERWMTAKRQARQASSEPFDLARGPLLRLRVWRLDTDDHLLLLTMHHIISDGWSAGVLVRELVAGYESVRAGQPFPLPPLPIQYADYGVWQRRWLDADSGVQEAQLAYWRPQLSGAPALLELPTDFPRPPIAGRAGDRVPVRLSTALIQRLAELSRERGATLYMTLLAAFQVLLSRYSGQTDLVVGSPIAGRTRPEIEPLIGFFVNTLVMRTDLSGNPSFREALARTREVALQAYAHQDLPFEVLVDALQPARDLSYSPIFQVMFVLQNAPVEPLRVAELTFEPVEVSTGTTMFDLTLSLTESADGVAGWLEYRTDLFRRSTMERFVGHFQTLLEGAAEDPDQPIGQLPLLTPAERHQLIHVWNDTACDYPLHRTPSEMFEEQVRRTPEATALVFEDQHLSYADLNRRANQLARYLRQLGAGPETIVAVGVERSPDQIVAVVAIAKAGAAYLPLDLNLPLERLRFMLDDTGAPIVLTQQRVLGRLPASGARIAAIDRDWDLIAREDGNDLKSLAGSNSLAYVIYTSGSTGQPKGVMIENRSLTNYNLAALNRIHRDSTGRNLQSNAVSFDPSVSEIWQSLIIGATLVQIRDEQLFSAPELYQVLRAQRITHFGASVAMLTVMPNDDLPFVRSIITGGDQVSREVVQRWAPGRLLVNGYGPTETTVSSSYYICHPDDPTDPPIGRPVPNTQLYVLDQHQQLVPIGVPGELYIGGAGVGRGYFNRPELTAERFVPDSFGPDPNARLYRTGDLVRRRPDGILDFLGRIDSQVKVRGFRIELGEIEARLRQHPAVLNAAVAVQNGDAASKRLVGYLVTKPGEVTPSSGELRRFLLQTLPDYMVPALFVVLEELPLLPSGKLDRKALPAPETDRAMLATPFVAPRNETEKTLAAIWADVLRAEQVGIHDNFFEIGGDSILAVQIIARANQAGLPLSPQHLFQAQTVASLAEIADQADAAPSPEPQPIVDAGSRQPGDDGSYSPSDFPLAGLDQEKLDQLLTRLNRTKGSRH